jgi:hypothetical protein
MMTAVLPTSRLETVCRKWQQHLIVAFRAVVVLIVASGRAISFGAVVECLTTVGVVTADQRYEATPLSIGPSLVDVFDGWYNDPTAATPWTAGAARRHVVDRWWDEP